jgi:methylenetetrahydrofolate reductase (NADPH)
VTTTTAYPDGHTESTTDEDGQIKHLKAKVDAGAEFIITQLFYDADSFLNWLRKVRAAGNAISALLFLTLPHPSVDAHSS